MTTLQGTLAGPGSATLEERPRAVRRRSVRMLRPTRAPAGVAVALTVSVALSAAVGGTFGLLTGSPFGLVPYQKLATGAGALSWSDPAVAGVSVLLVAGGLLLVALAAVPGRTRLVPLETGDPLTVIGLTRTGLRRTLRAAAESVDGVERARVSLGPRQVEVVVITDAQRTGRLLRQVGAAVGDRLGGVGAMYGGEVVVRLRGRGN
ncbi:DUF6286 domain-containing protein [Planomonospora venezuelensis]|uniref:DUF6286 domain-containing protein n=1 Tax=Planomonospora venezuelensis TaxID=1999 RepID=A0A841D5E6_PLAVE|nr:DUF6286 domain-containing protein [Planomonospora venezuelensis]MBB5965872.1 hypothetical protein [Planomonospora venezuelensis]GIN04066.1 hypothetical protein Pve01_57240 [Planomonospora venezuelensis]